MKNLVFILALLLSFTGSCQTLKEAYDAAVLAYNEKNYEKFYADIVTAGKIHPYHQGVFYLRGKASALTGRKEEALSYLRKAILVNASFPLERVSDFDSIKDTEEFNRLLALQQEQWKPVIHSDTAFVLKDRSLHTEGIAINSKQDQFYLGSIHKRKVILSDAQGHAKDLVPQASDEMTSVFGLQVNSRKKILWAVSSPTEVMENPNDTLRSIVFKFNLNGKLLKKFYEPASEKQSVFGDLTLNHSGEVFISESKRSKIFTVDEKLGKIEPFFSSLEFSSLQGLAFSPDDTYLFIADYIKGIFRLNVKTKELMLLESTDTYSLKGIDGLYFYNNSLIAIQNGVSPFRVCRFYLDSDLRAITRFTILDRAHPAFNEPTLGVISKDTFYYIANSQWGGYTERHQLKPVDQLQDIVILRCDLATSH